jgi:hypothetical protein
MAARFAALALGLSATFAVGAEVELNVPYEIVVLRADGRPVEHGTSIADKQEHRITIPPIDGRTKRPEFRIVVRETIPR